MSECRYIETPGPLDPAGRRTVTTALRGETVVEKRWVCSCGSSGHWISTTYLRPRTIDQRLRSGHLKHIQRQRRGELK